MAGRGGDQRRPGVPPGTEARARVQPVPLTPHSAAQIVKAYARRAGLDA
jgi:hypothetical protein